LGGALIALWPSSTGDGEEAELQRRGLGLGNAPPLAPDVEAEVRTAAAANGIDPDIAAAQFRQEAGGYDKHSAAGAFGPAQLMPDTAKGLGVATSTDDPNYSWQSNADAGVRYFKEMLTQYHGNYVQALVAYNWGPGNADKWNGDPSTLPKETQIYLARILGNARAAKAAVPGADNTIPAPDAAASGAPNPDGPINTLKRLSGQAAPDPSDLPPSVQQLMAQLRADQNPGHIGLDPDSAAFLSKRAAAHARLTGNGARWGDNSGSTAGNSTHSEVHVGTITIHTAATDAGGIAQDIKKHLSTYNIVNNGARGLA
jgi:Transglycosylase SLT domain